MLHAQDAYLDIGEPMLRKVALDLVQDVLRALVRDQAKVNLGGGLAREARLRPGTSVAGSETADRARRLEETALDQLDSGHTQQILIDAKIAAAEVIVPSRREPSEVLDLL